MSECVVGGSSSFTEHTELYSNSSNIRLHIYEMKYMIKVIGTSRLPRGH